MSNPINDISEHEEYEKEYQHEAVNEENSNNENQNQNKEQIETPQKSQKIDYTQFGAPSKNQVKKNQTKKKTSKKNISKKPEKIPLDKNLVDKYKETSLRSMNYRVGISQLQEKSEKLEKEISSKNKKLEKELKEIEKLKSCITKLEQTVQKKIDTDNNADSILPLKSNNKKEKIKAFDCTLDSRNYTLHEDEKSNNEENANKITISMKGPCPVITMDDGQGNKNVIKSKSDIIKFLNKVYSENQNLKNFQNQVFNLSKNYDDINNILNESIAGFQEIIKATGDSNLEQKVNNSLSDLKTQIESSLEKKQNEYNQQLAKKEESLNVLFNTYGSIEKEILQRKLDKFHEQKTIENLNTQIEILQTKLSLLKKKDTNEK